MERNAKQQAARQAFTAEQAFQDALRRCNRHGGDTSELYNGFTFLKKVELHSQHYFSEDENRIGIRISRENNTLACSYRDETRKEVLVTIPNRVLALPEGGLITSDFINQHEETIRNFLLGQGCYPCFAYDYGYVTPIVDVIRNLTALANAACDVLDDDESDEAKKLRASASIQLVYSTLLLADMVFQSAFLPHTRQKAAYNNFQCLSKLLTTARRAIDVPSDDIVKDLNQQIVALQTIKAGKNHLAYYNKLEAFVGAVTLFWGVVMLSLAFAASSAAPWVFLLAAVPLAIGAYYLSNSGIIRNPVNNLFNTAIAHTQTKATRLAVVANREASEAYQAAHRSWYQRACSFFTPKKSEGVSQQQHQDDAAQQLRRAPAPA